jgi:ketosteroid isomerase-like protein
MSAENVELIRATFPQEIDIAEIFASDDPVRGFIGNVGAVAEDLEVEFGGSASGALGQRYQGLEGLVAGWRDWLTPWESYLLEVEDVLDAGDQVVTLVRVRAKTSRHGVEVEHRPAAVWTLRDGKLTAVRFFLERTEALAFAGLPPHN